MKKLVVVLAMLGYVFGATGVFAGAEDCTDEQQWNEETQKCEPKE